MSCALPAPARISLTRRITPPISITPPAPPKAKSEIRCYAPRLGDLLCFGRGHARALTFADLPTAHRFPGHCAIVVAGKVHQLSVIGGNVDDAVVLQHIPADDAGRVGLPWMVVLRVMYQR